MRFTKGRAGALAGVVVAVGAVAVVPASATDEAYTTDGHGSAEFVSKGEHFYVHDYSADGHGVVAYLWASKDGVMQRVTPPGGVYNGNGLQGAPEHRNYSIPEDHYVEYQVCLVDGPNGTPFNCGGWLGDIS